MELAAGLALAACQAPTPGEEAAATLDDLELVPAPESPLVVLARWTTSDPGDSVVEFRDPSGQAWRIADPSLVQEHEVVVVGMRPATDYEIVASSTLADGRVLGAEAEPWTTPALPYDWIGPRLKVWDETLAQPGWTLFNLVCGLASPPVALVVDEEARVAWYFSPSSATAPPDLQVTMTSRGGVLLGPAVPTNTPILEVDLAGRTTWEGPINDLDQFRHHVFQELDNGNYITTVSEEREDGWLADVLTEIAPDHSVAWSWAFSDHVELDPEDVTVNGKKQRDFTHVNGVSVDLDAGTITASAKYLDRVYQVDRQTGQVLWVLGSGGDFAADPDATRPWFAGAHSPTLLPGDRLLLLDNQTDLGTARAVEYDLDFSTMTAHIAWQHPPEGEQSPWVSLGWGNADRLDNGNTLIVPGEVVANEQSVVVEVTPSGAVAWEMDLGTGTDDCPLPLVFRAVRIAALAERLP
ncbi:aryl-sulfate sulfotransferase [Myxococcota bacterium]|nr:aryl-sulfate sulfotransferase [Myxococcota bacterium]